MTALLALTASQAVATPRGSAARLGRRLPDIAFLLLVCLVDFATLLLPGPWRRQYVAAGDFSRQFYAFQAYAAQRLAQGQLPLWDPYILGGQAHLADPQTALFYPVGLLINLIVGRHGLPYVALEWRAAIDVLLGAWFSYAFIAHVARSRAGGVVGAVAFTFGGYLASYPLPQLPVLEASIWLPLVLYLLERGLTAPQGCIATPWFAAAGLAGALLLLAGHDQTAMLAAYAAGAYAVARWAALRRPVGRTSGQLLLAALIAAGLSAPQWLPALAYLPVTNRVSLPYAAASGGYGWRDFGQLLLPGGYFLRSYYIGLLPLLLAIIALRWRAHWGWAALWSAAALLALGGHGPVYPLLYGHVPGFAAFEDQERAAYIAAFAEATLAGLGAGRLLRHLQSSPIKRRTPTLGQIRDRPTDAPPTTVRASLGKAARAPALIGLVTMALTVAGALLLRQFAPPVNAPAVAAPLAANLLAAGLLAGGALIALVAIRFRLLGVRFAAILLCLLPAINLLGANGGLGRSAVDPAPVVPTAVAAYLHGQPGVWRVDTLRDGELAPNIGALLTRSFPRGDDPLVIRRSATLAGEADRYKVWQLFNVQYVLSRQDPGTGFQLQARLDGFNVFRMLYPLPRAWAVQQAVVAPAPSEALAATMALKEPGTSAVLETPLPGAIATAATPLRQTVDWLTVAPERLQARVTLSAAALLVISQPFAPGWAASVDGRPAPLLRADYAFVALALPAGSSVLLLRYVPAGLVPGAVVAAGAALLLIAGVFWPLTAVRRAGR